MRDQHCILEILSQPSSLATLQELRAQADEVNRAAFVRQVCQAFDLRDSRGQWQLATCLKALRGLEDQGHLRLPAARPCGRRGPGRPRGLDQPVPAAQAVPARVEAVAGLQLSLVTTDEQRQVWNELMAREHPYGAVLHVGAQVRYLIESEHGVLGALGFAAAALAVAARDEWIGWSAAMRRKRLHGVLNLSRFLIRPGVRCDGLASKVLGLVLRRLPADFQQRYRYRPVLLETYCDPQQHPGTCFRAAHWTYVGQTTGRGRFAAPDQRVPVKAIFVYPLQHDWRQQLGGSAPPPPAKPLEPGEGLTLDEFAQNELGGARLGDVRWSQRLVQTAQMQAAAPMASIPTAAQGQRAAIKGHYRLIDQPDDSAVTPDNMLEPHRQRTLRRMQAERVVLCVQGGTDLHFATNPGAGLGLTRKNGSAADTLEMQMHTTMALNPEGIPLGLLKIQYATPDGQADHGRPLEERKTFRWVKGLRECAALARQLPGTQLVVVMDGEADVQALFAELRQPRRVALLVRARHNRCLGPDQTKLFDHIRAQAAQAEIEMEVPRSSARRGSRQQAARAELRWQTVELPAPARGHEPLRLQLVHVWERSPAPGGEALEWFLLTTLPVTSLADAECVLRWYRIRWRIEDWHQILKSGCKIQDLGHRTAQRIARAVTIKAVIAWRLTALTLLGRATPEMPATVCFTPQQ